MIVTGALVLSAKKSGFIAVAIAIRTYRAISRLLLFDIPPHILITYCSILSLRYFHLLMLQNILKVFLYPTSSVNVFVLAPYYMYHRLSLCLKILSSRHL